LINVLPEKDFDIDLLLMNPEYDMKNQINRKVNYIDSFQYVMNTTDTIPEINNRGGISKNLGRFISYCTFRLKVKLKLKKVWNIFKPLPTYYDVAIAYSQNDYSPYYVIDKVKSNRKVLWYHNGAYEKGAKSFELDEVYYHKFDYVVAVSLDCAKVLDEKFKFDNKKLIVLRNICDVTSIVNRSNEFIPTSYNSKGLHITSVGRLTKEKGSDIAIETCKRLIEGGYDIYWHWVGDGNQREEVLRLISDYKLKDRFILEGNQNNPYPFIKNTDIYVQPSYYEAYSTTITEAKVLNKPIVTTDVGGMRDQIENEKNGFIVSIDVNELYCAIVNLIEDKELITSLTINLSKEDFTTDRYLKDYYNTIFL
jgi:glycosyltransferase involved in cell wall biosynthesis